jgi:phosphatidate cytidylyltransferase
VDNPAPPSANAGHGARRELLLRVVSSAVLGPVAIGAAWLGGLWFDLFWTVAAFGILFEWRKIIAEPRPAWGGMGVVGIAGAAVSAVLRRADAVVLSLVVGAGLEALGATRHSVRIWAAAGILYGGSLVGACVLLRNDAGYGFAAIMFLFAIVWATDILAYFVGRFIGGPKLWMRVSPNKTWSGAAGGALGAVIAGLAVAHYAHLANPLAVAGLALVLSAVSQAGDLFESSFKRRFGVKDASHVIPGHGGFMDRLDGFLAAAVVAVLIGIARVGMSAPARGLLVW